MDVIAFSPKEGVTRSGPLGTGKEGRNKGLKLAATYNKEGREPPLTPAVAAAAGGGGDGAGPSAPYFEARDRARREAAARQAAAAEDVDVDVEDLSQQMGDLSSPSKPPAPKKPKKGGDGVSSSQALELTETQE